MYCMRCGSKIAEYAQYRFTCGERISPNLSQSGDSAFAQYPMASSSVRPTNPIQAAGPTTSLQIKSPGAWMIIGGGVLCLLAFFCMPYIIASIGGATMSGVQLAGFQPDNSVTWLQALWLQALLALVITVCAIPAAMKAPNESAPLGALVIMLTIGMFIVEIAATTYLNSQMSNSYSVLGDSSSQVNVLSYYGVGFWVYNLGLLLATIGGFIHLQNNPVDRIEHPL